LTAPASGPVEAALRRLVGQGALQHDTMQLAAAQALDAVEAGLAERPRGLFGFGRVKTPVKGLYLVGSVGRGKTLLMDLFVEASREPKRRRVHFHQFMDEVHAAIAAFRASPRGKDGRADPIGAVVKSILVDTRLLCLDEFQVTDITNAMILGRLFEQLFAGGVVLVATSNVAPRDLYRNGLNRQLFLPFIDLLERHVDLLPLDGPTDYRRLKFSGRAVFFFGEGDKARAAMDAIWHDFTGGVEGAPTSLVSLGRTIAVPKAAMGVARFPFAALCEVPLGARDYLRIAERFDALVIDGVPQFDRTRPSAAKRFILLVDTLYDMGVKLAASFAVPIDQLGVEKETRFEFARTASRLIEMQSDAYLGQPRRAASAQADTQAPAEAVESEKLPQA
jgi:cell division protein ZapE